MRQALLASLAIAVFAAPPAHAQNWSIGAGVGPFIFGTLVRETLRPVGSGGGEPTDVKLTAKARPGVAVDIERDVSDRFAVRLDAAFTQSKLQVKSASAGGVSLDVGTLDVTTFTVPLVIRFNPRGTFRFHIMGGPAYAMYNLKRDVTPAGVPDSFSGTRSNWGGAAGGGVGWWFSDHFALEGQITDIVTASPFKRSEFTAQNVKIPKSQNVHTTAGIRVRF